MVKLFSIWEVPKHRRTILCTALFLVLSLAICRLGFSKPSPIVNQAQVEWEGNARG
jgi:hypothetical protein